jgi:hypothetical protein
LIAALTIASASFGSVDAAGWALFLPITDIGLTFSTNEIGSFFGNHNGWSVGIAPD